MTRCKVMGIVNVTPDSFSDGGKFYKPEEAIRRAKNLVDEGADIIDLGGESTRPGAEPITWEEEWARLEPVIRGLGTCIVRRASCDEDRASCVVHRASCDGRRAPLLSIDTYHPETAERALALGAGMINCVYEGPVPQMLELCAQKGAEIVIPAKSLGSVPKSLVPQSPGSVPGETGSVPLSELVWIDPMIGFGTTREEDLAILQSIPELAKRGRVLIGASRKRIVKKLVGEKTPGKDLAGNLTIATWAALNGASCVRVHDVRETVQALRVLDALRG